MRLGLRDTQVQAPTKTSIGLWGIDDQHLSSTIQKQQLFWIGNHFEADVRHNFADTLSKAIEQGYTKEMLADTLKDQFNDLTNRSSHYWQGLAEHTALRIREFGRLQGYKKAKARYLSFPTRAGIHYNILDDRTSDICRALAAQDKIYPLNDALKHCHSRFSLEPWLWIQNQTVWTMPENTSKPLHLGSRTIRSNMTQR